MVDLCKENLIEIKNLLLKLRQDQYSRKSRMLSGASIGQHIRHILEFYVCLLDVNNTGIVNYDARERNAVLENNTFLAIEVIRKILQKLSVVDEDNQIILKGCYSTHEMEIITINTSILRELMYNLEHSIHHQALIKIGLKEQGLGYLINDSFGVAPATIRYKTSCPQKLELGYPDQK